MAYLVALLRPRRPSWPTVLVAIGVGVVALALGLDAVRLGPPAVSTVLALAGGTAFALGVSASVSAFFERDTYADSDFYR
ncbi:hypothetical protein [Microlunatus antarcticus]|uniref:Uncharacterized protein n=1 Tax=Microlunatus antarcticus TaxID=53388 RepID=A0A7W5JYH0_9ACTN|nr:hypothetical protein [Microlunatus antarcticus]MBB3328466.1 hypothetical protein [Microlunatus antarcticus]